jgi:hypothetical protein
MGEAVLLLDRFTGLDMVLDLELMGTGTYVCLFRSAAHSLYSRSHFSRALPSAALYSWSLALIAYFIQFGPRRPHRFASV